MKRIAALMLAGLLAAAPVSSVYAAEQAQEEMAVIEGGVADDAAAITTNSIEGWPQAANTSSEAALIMDAATGTVLFSKNGDTQLYPASVTKILTTLLALEKGNPDDVITMTQTGVNYAISGSSNLNTQVGEQFTLRDALYAVMLKSANDLATQVGEHIGGGSLENFVQMMNDRCAELGCTNTHFNNACGMPDPDHVTTAHDLALIGQACIAREDFRKIIGTWSYTIPATNMSPERSFTSHVAMLVAPEYQYPGILGGKTGYTDAAENCLITFDEQDGRTLICVTLKAVDAGLCVNDHKQLYDYALQNFDTIPAWDRPDEIISGGNVTVPKGTLLSELTREEAKETDNEGRNVVRISYSYHGTPVGSVTVSQDAVNGIDDSEVKSADDASQTKDGQGVAEQKNQKSSPFLFFKTLSFSMKLIAILGVMVTLGVVMILLTLLFKR